MSNDIKQSSEAKKLARELLEQGKVSAVIGYAEGTLKGRVQTLIARNPLDAEKFIFNEYCVNNLAVYLTKSYRLLKSDKPVAVFLKPCDIRTVTALIQEHQIKREDIFIIGMSCQGVRNGNGLSGKCRACRMHNPQYSDAVIGEAIEEKEPEVTDPFARVKEIENMSTQERWQFWTKEFDKCIRCYACRQACPLCYCEQCIVDKTQPRWIESSAHPVGNMAWHLIRAFHLAGRCIGCGECDRVCHQNIPLSLLNMKMSKEIFDLYGYRSGVDPEAKPPLTEFKMEDNEEFIR
ncbi:MAG: Fe-S oxidoreductase [Bacteroidota bacterium]|jgi:ferredoxin|nr:Fe-S oxidoreductase [Ignavibacteria bacterium]MCU7500420.1 Fe-S oxidoreductase [Ignavibacteria bacterium]MCU7514303.1 Fe-S oxidoreductase [Ignavibacteria bacterium]MCU7521914.1 Fe-S oxidoreductase [Ignavibacteria bacterium]MCU7526111.1 Fe-S oxidoreductase [Ignavibacteria bacterium]